jgi:hypothetical protein
LSKNILPHPFQESPYVDILAWHAEREKLREEEYFDEKLKILKASYKASAAKRHQHRLKRYRVLKKMVKVAGAIEGDVHPVLPEHQDQLKGRDYI